MGLFSNGSSLRQTQQHKLSFILPTFDEDELFINDNGWSIYKNTNQLIMIIMKNNDKVKLGQNIYNF